MDANPYAPPQAAVADVPTVIGLKRRRVITMIVFTFLTLGIYYMAWFLRRRPGLNRLNSPMTLGVRRRRTTAAKSLGADVVAVELDRHASPLARSIQAAAQSSILNPGTRANSRSLAVTSIAPRRRAWPAISTS